MNHDKTVFKIRPCLLNDKNRSPILCVKVVIQIAIKDFVCIDRVLESLENKNIYINQHKNKKELFLQEKD